MEQAKKHLEVARGSRLDALLLMALTTGMRRGELVGLHWSDVDLEIGILQVRYTVGRIAGLGLIVGEPKSKAGRRKIMLSQVVIETLKKHKANQEHARTEADNQQISAIFSACAPLAGLRGKSA